MKPRTKLSAQWRTIAGTLFPATIFFFSGAFTGRILSQDFLQASAPPPVANAAQLPAMEVSVNAEQPVFRNAPRRVKKPPVFEAKLSRFYFPQAESLALVNLMRRVYAWRNGMVTYLEYGSGGSTTELTPYANIAVSVEHDMSWCKLLTGRLAKAAIVNVHQVCIPPERRNSTHIARNFGWEGDYVGYKKYIEAVERPGLPKKYDVVLIDGRARVPVALEILPFLHNDSVVVLHDAIRNWYNSVEKYYIVETANMAHAKGRGRNGLKVMRMRNDIQHFPRGYEIQEFLYKNIKKLPSGALRTIE